MFEHRSWSDAHSPWVQSFAGWRKSSWIEPGDKVKGFPKERALGVRRAGRGVVVRVVEHDWEDAYSRAREKLAA